MNKSFKIILSLAIVAAVVVGGMFLLAGNDSGNGNNTDTSGNNSDTAKNNGTIEEGAEPMQEAAATITYTGSGFSPATVTVSAGDVVRIVNNSDTVISPSSDDHPVHTDNPELNFGDISPGESVSVTVNQAGEWGIHNHYLEDHQASIVVQ
jgi:plastocyanin